MQCNNWKHCLNLLKLLTDFNYFIDVIQDIENNIIFVFSKC